MIIPLPLPDPFAAAWYHGTHASQFESWLFPPPASSPVDVPHTALFFSADRDYAAAAGSNVCQVTLLPSAKVLTPAHENVSGDQLRQAMLRSTPLAGHCLWLSDKRVWANAWATGEVMRFAFNRSDSKAVYAMAVALGQVATNIKKIIKTSLPDNVIQEQAMLCLTRGWIEQLVREAKGLGYQALHGAEVDRWNKPGSPPTARSWLAVLEANAVTKPTW